jgi:hypothetical protein
VIAAIDFFTVPTVTFRVLYCFFAISHGRRRILHLNVTEHPTGKWIAQQLRDAFPDESAHRYLILDHDAKFTESVLDVIKAMGMKPIRIAYQSPGETVWLKDGLRVPTRSAGPRDSAQRRPFKASESRLPRVLSRRSNS